MIINNKEIVFRPDTPIPYFQVNDDYRIRFGYEKLTTSLIRKVLSFVLQERTMHLCVCYRSIDEGHSCGNRPKLGKYFNITNWKEEIVIDNEDASIQYQMVNIKNILNESIIKYAIEMIIHEKPEAFIHFYDDTVDVFISNDVIDIVSTDKQLIEILKNDYEKVYDRYWVGKVYE